MHLGIIMRSSSCMRTLTIATGAMIWTPALRRARSPMHERECDLRHCVIRKTPVRSTCRYSDILLTGARTNSLGNGFRHQFHHSNRTGLEISSILWAAGWVKNGLGVTAHY